MTDLKLPIAVRDDVDVATASFKLDAALGALWTSGKLTPHWKSEAQVLGFGRFALDKAIHMSIGASEKLLLPEIVDDWSEISERAERASKALTEFVSWTAGPAYFSTPPKSAARRVSTWKAHTLRPAFGKMAATSGASFEVGLTYAETIASAETILAEFAGFAKSRRNEIGAKSQNPGDPVLAEFILRMVETWFLLTGKVPSSNARPESNRFLQFAIVAWQDAGGEGPTGTTFAQSALANAVAFLKSAIAAEEGYVPVWAKG